MRRTMARGTGPVRVALILGAALSLVALTGLTPAIAGAAQIGPHATATPPPSPCAANGQGETCTPVAAGTFAPDPFTGGFLPGTPTVTVNQTRNLTNQMVHVSWTNFESSLINVPGQVGFSPGETDDAVAIVECKGLDPTIDTSAGLGQTKPNGSCYALRTGVQSGAASGPGNELLTFTSQDQNDDAGTGSADFQIETQQQNTFLGCDSANPCSLVVVPNWGGDQINLGTGQQADCADHSQDGALPVDSNDPALDTRIGYVCSWADRIVVPLSFAPTPGENCPPQDAQFNAEGAPGLEQAMNQWLPGWCKPSSASGQAPVFVGYDSTVNEYLARQNFLGSAQALSASTDVALVTDPASADATSGARPFTYAPVGDSAISIVYYVDNQADGTPVTNLVLNARLMAKLLTQSYALSYGQCDTQSDPNTPSATCDPAVMGNPLDIFHDPEFLKLNPGYTTANFLPSNPQHVLPDFMPTVLAGNSDMTFELTRWIESDPEARAFLAGQPDQWGMHVNDNYRGIGFPIPEFLPKDPGWTNFPNPGESIQLTWNPLSGLDNVVQRFAGNTSTSLNLDGPKCSLPDWNGGPCTGGTWNYPLDAPQNIGSRALFAVVDQGSTAAFRFPVAKIVNAAGTAVAPTTTSMSSALNNMETNPDKITQFANDTSADPAQYPLTTVDYAMVPTCGLSQAKATAISQFLNNVATSAQDFGTNPGDLPEFGGYLALTDQQKAQTQAAATKVGTQSCTSPPPDTTVSGTHQSTVQPPSSGGQNVNGPGVSGSTSQGTTSAKTASGTPGNHNSTTPSGSGSRSKPNTPLGLKSLDTNGFASLVLPVALGLGGLLVVIACVTYALNATERGRSLLNRIRRRLGIPPRVGDGIGDVE